MGVYHMYQLAFGEKVKAVLSRPLSPRVALAEARLRKFAQEPLNDSMIVDAETLAQRGMSKDVAFVFSDRKLLAEHDESVRAETQIRLAHRMVEVTRKEVRDAYFDEMMRSEGSIGDMGAMREAREKLASAVKLMREVIGLEHVSDQAKKILRNFIADAEFHPPTKTPTTLKEMLGEEKRENPLLLDIIRNG